MVILNIGSGCDGLSGALHEDEWIGVDIGGNPDVQHDLNVTPWPFENNYADSIRAVHILEHLKNPASTLSECHRVLKPGGTLHIKVPHAWGLYAHKIDHISFFTCDSFIELTSGKSYIWPDKPFQCDRYRVTLMLGRWTPFDWVASRFPWFWEKFGFIKPDEIEWIGKALKPE